MINTGITERGQRKPSQWVTLIAAVVLVLTLVSSIILGLALPRTQRIYSADEGRVTSIAPTDTDEWFYSTSKGYVYRMNGDNEETETLNLNKEAEKFGIQDGVGEIRGMYENDGAKYMYALTSEGYLFQLEDADGALSVRDQITVRGTVGAIVEKNDELYVLNKISGYNEIRKYDANNLSEQPTTGYIYQWTQSHSTIKLSFLKNITVLSFDVVEEANGRYIYICHMGGIIRMSTDMGMNAWEGKLANGLQTKVDAFYQQLYNEELQSGVAEEDINTKRLENKALEMAYEDFGIVDYDEIKGDVTIDKEKYDHDQYGYYRSGEISFCGSAYIDSENKYYLFAADGGMYTYDMDDLNPKANSIKATLLPGMKLAGIPQSQGKSLYYNKVLKKGYVVYEASNKLTLIDFEKEQVEFTSAVEFNIRGVVQNGTGDQIYFLYQNANEEASGTLILRSLTIGGQTKEPTIRAFLTVTIILCILSAVCTLFGALCLWKKGFSEKFMHVMKGFVKQWGVYAILLGSLVLLCLFCYYPAVASIALSFFDYTLDTPAKLWNNFAHYKQIFTSMSAGEEFGNLFFFLICDVFTALAPPLIFAFFLTIMKNKGYSALTRTLLFIPGVIPGVATTLIWKTGIYGEYGVLNAVIQWMNGNPVKFLASTDIAKWSLVLMGFPYVGSYLIFYGAMMNVPDSYYEAAELDGITVIKRFVFIDVPMIFPQIKYVLIMTFIASVQNFGRTYMVTHGNWGTKTPIFTMYKSVLDGNYGLASAYATILFIFLFFATVLNLRMQRKDNEVA